MSEAQMAISGGKSAAISLTVCQLDNLSIPAWLSDYPVPRSDNSIAIVSWLQPELISQIGMPKAGICGFLRESTEAIEAGNFVEYAPFMATIHRLCKAKIDPNLKQYARARQIDRVALIDQRSPYINAEIPTEDIIGSYQNANESTPLYMPNLNFCLITDKGCFQLTPWLRGCLEALVKPGEGGARIRHQSS